MMIPYLFESRSKPVDEDIDAMSAEPGRSQWTFPWGEVLFTLFFPIIIVLICLYPLLYAAGYGLLLCGRALLKLFHGRKWVAPALMIIILIAVLFGVMFPREQPVPAVAPALVTEETDTVTILVDDFKPQPYQGEYVYFYNRLEGDRGAINNSQLTWGDGWVRLEVAPGATWGGVWTSLNHPMRENLPINFSALLPGQIRSAYQSRITALSVVVESGTPGRILRFELKDGSYLRWKNQVRLTGQPQSIRLNLPALGEINQLVWVLDRASAGDFVTMKRISLTATNPIEDVPTAAFVWSYAMLLDNWNPDTGLVRDKSKDAAGEFDAVQSTGSLAAATALAEQLGVVEYGDAVRIVHKIAEAMRKLPRYHGLWPHWVRADPSGRLEIVPNTEWSSVDTVIGMLGLLDAQTALSLDTSNAEQMLRDIDWQRLLTSKGISHGYDAAGQLIPYAWDTFGGESWLVQAAYAAATGNLAPLAYPTPPTANGSGFIDELAWLYLPPPNRLDAWGTDWAAYRSTAAAQQIAYAGSGDCNAAFGFFGLSASEVPDPARVPPVGIYRAFGLGGRFMGGVVDQGGIEGSVVISPHYAAMVAALRPQEASKMWGWLIELGLFSPLTNVESLVLPRSSGCDPDALVWNQLKGSWNLSLQALGWGNYLVQRNGKTPAIWRAAETNSTVRAGYLLLVPEEAVAQHPSAQQPWKFTRECEHIDSATVGQTIARSNASGRLVHGQFGAIGGKNAWSKQAGYVEYRNIHIPQTGQVVLRLRYSKNTPYIEPISVYLDSDTTNRASIHPQDLKSWDEFTWTEAVPLGQVAGGEHTLRFYVYGQNYGVADLDVFTLEMDNSPIPAPVEAAPTPSPETSNLQGLLVWYDFEEDLSSGQVSDRSGNGLDARLNGQASTTPGISGGNAIHFSGNGFLRSESNPAAGKTSITFSLWLNTDSPRENYKLASAAWWQQGPAAGWIMATHMPELWSDDTHSLYPEGIQINDNNFVPGKWIHELLTYDGERVKEYTDGQLINDWPSTGKPIGTGVPMVIGAWPPYTAYNLVGALDEFQIFDRCLTAEEIRAIYEQGRP